MGDRSLHANASTEMKNMTFSDVSELYYLDVIPWC